MLAKVQGGKFADGFTGSVLGSLGAAGANIIGVETQGMGLTNVITHALLGCGVAAAGGKDCSSGALGGATSALLSPWLNEGLMGSGLTETERNTLVAGGSVLTAILLAEALGKDKIVAGNAAANEVLNNFLSKESIAARNKALAFLRSKQGFEGWLSGWNEGDLIEQAANTAIRANDLDNRSDNLLKTFIQDPNKLTPREYMELAVYVDDYAASYGVEAAQKLVQRGPEPKMESGDYVDLLAYAQSRANLLAVHNSQAEVGTPALMALSGSLGTILRTAGFAGASFELGQGLGMVYGGDSAGLYTTGLAILGMAGGNKAPGSIPSASLAGKTGTVFDAIKPTQPVYPGSTIPRSFEMTLPNGQRVWVAGNATEHMAEFAQMKAVNYAPEAVRLASQEQLASLQAAANTATKNGVLYNQVLNIDGWELKFAPPRQPGQLPSLIHALQK